MRVLSVACVLLVSLAAASCSGDPGADAGDQDTGAVGDSGTDAGGDDAADALESGIDATADAADAIDAPDMGSACDMDGDGFASTECHGQDCNDADPNVHPGATELCDAIDENCDGIADALPDGGYDPAADMQCMTDFVYDAGNVGTAMGPPTHCYLRPSSTSPCPYGLGSGATGMCQGCWNDRAPPNRLHCWGWCNESSIQCEGECTPR